MVNGELSVGHKLAPLKRSIPLPKLAVTHITLPYGRRTLSAEIPAGYQPELIALAAAPPKDDPQSAVTTALDNLLGGVHWREFSGKKVAIAINDNTRPVPHNYLLPPLLKKLERSGFHRQHISLIIATGAHPPMKPHEFSAVVPPSLLGRYAVSCHDTDDTPNLVNLGVTSRGTPVWINRQYMNADLRIVVGNIEPHQFQGFSGGVKSAAIGLAGRNTINHNHAMMVEEGARLGHYHHNPPRQDVEEIGEMIGVHLALNAILNDRQEIVEVAAGQPGAVMLAGIPLAKKICQAFVAHKFDLVIASPGGHPKDINVYQAQKGLAHASLITRDGGTVILVAACPAGTGSEGYEKWVFGRHSSADVLAQFAQEGFRVGPHKAFQIARDAARLNVLLVSDLTASFVRQLLLEPAPNLQSAINQSLSNLPAAAKIAIIPKANVTIPLLSIKH